MPVRHDPVVVFPDVEKLVIGFLLDRKAERADMADWNFGTSLTGEALPFFRIQRVGGWRPVDFVLDTARIDLEVRARTREQAHDVMQLGLALLLVMSNYSFAGALVYRVGVEITPFYLPDPITDQPRWLSTIHITNRPQ